MTVAELIERLSKLDKNAIIDMSSDEEGNAFGNIDPLFGEGTLKRGGLKVYTLYPNSAETPEERYEA